MQLSEWPVVQRYAGAERARIAMPVGGIGTGTISLGGRGQLRDWELFNRPAKGHHPDAFLAIRTDDGGAVRTRACESALFPDELAGSMGSVAALAGLPRFVDGVFAAAYPFGSVELSDSAMPVTVSVGATNPVVPGDADASGLPIALLRIDVRNDTSRDVDVDLCLNVPAVLGYRPGEPLPSGNTVEEVPYEGGTLLLARSGEVAQDAESWGTLAVATLGRPASSHRTTWARRSWGDSLLEFWDDFHEDGRLEEPDEPARVPTASLVLSARLAPGETHDFAFVIGWHFPNRRAWSHEFRPAPDFGYGPETVGNYYAAQYADAADVIRRAAPQLAAAEERSAAYVRSVIESDLPDVVAEAALSSVATLKSTTCFRIADGTFCAWEGSHDDHGSCHGSCTHVWNYQHALEVLFPDLAWTMRDVELEHALDDRGMMSFRVGIPLPEHGTGWRVAAADGQMGALVRLWRTYLLTGDDDHLRRLWPAARKALEFAWVPLGWDADEDGVMEGCQHNTMDVEYYGPNGYGQSWYLAGLAAMSEIAQVVGDSGFAERCRSLRDRGARSTDAGLFNGDYYEHQIRPPGSAENIADGLRIRYAGDSPDVGSDDLVDPDLQLGPGCASDQVVGDTVATLAGLSTGLDREHVCRAVASVYAFNRRAEVSEVFNPLRAFAVGSDGGLLNATYPRGGRPVRPFPYAFEVWTGLEYSAASGLALAGDHDHAEDVVADVRARHDGARRNPFNEIECGNHYVRSMAAFGLLSAWTHAVVDRRTDVVTVAPLPGRWPVIAGDCVGMVVVDDRGARYQPEHGPALYARVRATVGN